MQASRPRRHAYRRCHQVALHYPTVNLPVALPSGNSLPEPNQTAALQTHGVYNGAPTCQTGQTGQTGQTQAPRPRHTHTAVAIKLPCTTLR